MPIPLIVWGAIAGGAFLIGAGTGGGSYRAGVEIGEGLGDGVRFALPIAVGAVSVYALMQAAK